MWMLHWSYSTIGAIPQDILIVRVYSDVQLLIWRARAARSEPGRGVHVRGERGAHADRVPHARAHVVRGGLWLPRALPAVDRTRAPQPAAPAGPPSPPSPTLLMSSFFCLLPSLRIELSDSDEWPESMSHIVFESRITHAPLTQWFTSPTRISFQRFFKAESSRVKFTLYEYLHFFHLLSGYCYDE